VKKESGTDRNPAVEKTDCVVLIDYLDLAGISELMSPNSGYRVIKKFQYRDPFGIQVTFPFVNPEVYVFSRAGGDIARGSGGKKIEGDPPGDFH